MIEPGRSVPERARLESAEGFSTLYLTADEPGTLKHHDVFRDCVQGYREGLCNLCDGCGFFCQGPQDRAPRGVGNCRENTVKLFLGIFNHMVEHTRTSSRLSTSHRESVVTAVATARPSKDDFLLGFVLRTDTQLAFKLANIADTGPRVVEQPAITRLAVRALVTLVTVRPERRQAGSRRFVRRISTDKR